MTAFKSFKKILLENGEEVITVSRMAKEDIESVAALYRSIEINKENYFDKLNPSGKNTFENTGGMFRILSKEKVEELYNDSTELMLVAKTQEGKIDGIIWYSLKDDDFHLVETVKTFEDATGLDQIRFAHSQGTIVYGKEIIVTKDRKMKETPLLLFYVMLNHLRLCGYTDSTGEVYEVKTYRDDSGEYECGMLNQRSYHTLVNSGGNPIGVLPLRTIEMPGYSVCIESKMFIWNILHSVEQFQPLIKKFKISQEAGGTE